MNRPARRFRRRLWLLIGLSGLCLAGGCGGDDTVRGEGSIDIPESALKSYTSYIKEGRSKKRAAAKVKAPPKLPPGS